MNISFRPGAFSVYSVFRQSEHTRQSGRKATFDSVASAMSGGSTSIRPPGENCLYTGGDGRGQNTYIEYTDQSTPEDPIVRISGKSLSGPYDKTVHINDIDPRYATYPELCAVMKHLEKTGKYKSSLSTWTALPFGVDRGDFSKRQNFAQSIQACIVKNQRYNPAMSKVGVELLTLYEKFAKAHARK